MSSCIYLLTNTIDKKQYIGFTTKSLEFRFEQHKSAARNGVKSYLYNAIRFHGIDNFTSEIIYMSEDDNYCLKKAEVILIADYNTKKPNGYNMTNGGEGTLGRTYNHSESTKQKISKSHKKLNKKRTIEEKLHLSILNTGKIHSESTKQKISISNTGKIRSAEARQNMSKSQKGIPKSEATKQNMRGKIRSAEARQNMSKSKTKYPIPDKKQLIDMKHNIPAKDIAVYYNVPTYTVWNWFKKL